MPSLYTTFLEKGYPPETIAKNHHPLYINILRDAVNKGQLPLNEHNSYSLEVPDPETGELIEIQQHYAQLYLKYDPQFYVLLKRKTTQNNNLVFYHFEVRSLAYSLVLCDRKSVKSEIMIG